LEGRKCWFCTEVRKRESRGGGGGGGGEGGEA